PNSARFTSIWRTASLGTSTCCGAGPRKRSGGPRKAKYRPGHVVAVDLYRNPLALETLGDLAGDIAAGERVEDELPGLSQEPNEELRHRCREAGGMDRQACFPTASKILVAGPGVGNGQQVRRNGAAIVALKVPRDVVLGRPARSLVAVAQQSLH